MWLHRMGFFRTGNRTDKSFMRDKGVAAIYVLALVVTFFSRRRDLKAAAGVGGVPTQRTIHHFYALAIFLLFAIIIPYYFIM
jgi:hypothetical protein